MLESLFNKVAGLRFEIALSLFLIKKMKIILLLLPITNTHIFIRPRRLPNALCTFNLRRESRVTNLKTCS